MSNVVEIPTAKMSTHKRREAGQRVRDHNREVLRRLLVEHRGVSEDEVLGDAADIQLPE